MVKESASCELIIIQSTQTVPFTIYEYAIVALNLLLILMTTPSVYGDFNRGTFWSLRAVHSLEIALSIVHAILIVKPCFLKKTEE